MCAGVCIFIGKTVTLKIGKRLKVTASVSSVVLSTCNNAEPLEKYIKLSCIFTSTKIGVIKHWNRFPKGDLQPLNLTGQDLEQLELAAFNYPCCEQEVGLEDL